MTGLKPDTRYRAKIQTVNEFGASKWSEEYEFDTFGGFYDKTLSIEILTIFLSYHTTTESVLSVLLIPFISVRLISFVDDSNDSDDKDDSMINTPRNYCD